MIRQHLGNALDLDVSAIVVAYLKASYTETYERMDGFQGKLSEDLVKLKNLGLDERMVGFQGKLSDDLVKLKNLGLDKN